uniref:lebercilin-like protein n=1 Tax=Styela clava TaxID=7725 RepID=UPI00193A2893|nr:lebercilin-like protein [Styela clava]
MNVPYPRNTPEEVNSSPEYDVEERQYEDEYVSYSRIYSDEFDIESRRSVPMCSSKSPQKYERRSSQNCRQKTGHDKRKRSGLRNIVKKVSVSDANIGNTLVAKMLQAKRDKLNKLRNELFDITQKFEEISKENRILKTLQQKQEKVIRKFDETESDLPRLLSQQAEEEKSLRFRLRRARTAERELESKLRENSKSMLRMESTLRKLKDVVQENELHERSTLTKELADRERILETAEQKIEKLNKHVELTSNCFLRQINIERKRHRETKKKLDGMVKEFDETKSKLREKERALGNTNIYAMRRKRHIISKSKFSEVHESNFAAPPTLQTTEMGTEPEKLKSENDGNSNVLVHSPDITQVKKDDLLNSGNRTAHSFDQEISISTSEKLITNEQEHTDARTADLLFNSSEDIKNPSPFLKTDASEQCMPETYDSNKIETPNTELQTSSIFLTRKFETPSLQLLQKCDEKSTQKNEAKVTRHLDQNGRLLDFSNFTHQENKHENNNKNKKAHTLINNKEVLPNSISTLEPHNNECNLDCSNLKLDQIFVSKSELNTQKKLSSIKEDYWTEPKKYTVEKMQKRGYQFSKEIENLHLGIPSSIDGCKKRLEKLEKEVIYFGSYSPTVGDTPTRRKYLTVGNYNSTEKQSLKSSYERKQEEEETKPSDLLMKLFGKLETDKKHLLGDVNGIENCVLSARENCDYPWKNDLSSNLNANGDNLESPVKSTMSDIKEYSITKTKYDKEPT